MWFILSWLESTFDAVKFRQTLYQTQFELTILQIQVSGSQTNPEMDWAYIFYGGV